MESVIAGGDDFFVVLICLLFRLASPCRSLVQWHLKQINFKKFKQNYPFVAPLGKPL
jgi:hypothetical protein